MTAPGVGETFHLDLLTKVDDLLDLEGRRIPAIPPADPHLDLRHEPVAIPVIHVVGIDAPKYIDEHIVMLITGDPKIRQRPLYGVVVHFVPSDPPQHVDWCPQSILALSVCPVRRRVEELGEGPMPFLDLRERGRLLEAGICQEQLDLELRLDRILSGFALLDMAHLDAQLSQQSFVDV